MSGDRLINEQYAIDEMMNDARLFSVYCSATIVCMCVNYPLVRHDDLPHTKGQLIQSLTSLKYLLHST